MLRLLAATTVARNLAKRFESSEQKRTPEGFTVSKLIPDNDDKLSCS